MPVSLVDFIETAKSELVQYQREHEGERGFFKLNTVELEVQVQISGEGGAKFGIHVVEVGGEIAGTQTHTVRLSFSIAGNDTIGRFTTSFIDTPSVDAPLPIIDDATLAELEAEGRVFTVGDRPANDEE